MMFCQLHGLYSILNDGMEMICKEATMYYEYMDGKYTGLIVRNVHTYTFDKASTHNTYRRCSSLAVGWAQIELRKLRYLLDPTMPKLLLSGYRVITKSSGSQMLQAFPYSTNQTQHTQDTTSFWQQTKQPWQVLSKLFNRPETQILIKQGLQQHLLLYPIKIIFIWGAQMAQSVQWQHIGLDVRKIAVRLLAQSRYSYHFQNVHTDSRTHPTSYSMDTESAFRAG